MLTLYDISASGLTAARLRMAVVADNLANADTPGFQADVVELAPVPPAATGPDAGIGGGVAVTGIVPLPAPAGPTPGPAGANGPPGSNVSEVASLTDLISAQAAYAANATAFNAAKALDQRALTL